MKTDMKQISEIIQTNLKRTNSGTIKNEYLQNSQKTANSSSAVSARIEKLFACMSAAKHLKFTAAYPTEASVLVAKKVWQAGLSDLSDEEIGNGIKQLATWLPEFGGDRLPTLAEFKKQMCYKKQQYFALENKQEIKKADKNTAIEAYQKMLDGNKLNAKMRNTIIKILEKHAEQKK